MPEQKYQSEPPSPHIEKSEIQIPDDADFGTGTLTTIFSPDALPPNNVIVSSMVNRPHLQIAATLNPNGQIPVLIGKADGSDPLHEAIFILPKKIKKNSRHTLVVEFAAWHVLSATLDGVPLRKVGASKPH